MVISKLKGVVRSETRIFFAVNNSEVPLSTKLKTASKNSTAFEFGIIIFKGHEIGQKKSKK